MVELLVVITIIGILVALLLPAVQAAREAARRMQCCNNLKQIGMAAHNFEQQNHRFPPGYLGSIPAGGDWTGKAQYTGVLVFLLPYMEMGNIYDLIARIDVDRTSDIFNEHWGKLLDIDHADPNGGTCTYYYHDTEVTSTTHGGPAAKKIAQFICPSDLPYTKTPYWCCYQVGAKGWQAAQCNSIDAPKLGRTNYMGCMGETGAGDASTNYNAFNSQWQKYGGIFNNRSKTTFRDIKDGASNTFLFGEASGGLGLTGGLFSYLWFGCGAMCTDWNTYYYHANFSENDVGLSWFSSNHANAINFCLADGSTMPISGQTDQKVYRALAGMADGQTIRQQN